VHRHEGDAGLQRLPFFGIQCSRFASAKHKEDRPMSEMKRRDFLKSGTMAVAAAGVAAAIPIMPAVINAVDTDGPELDTTTAASTSEAASMSEPLIVRINDLASGSMQMFFGTREVTYADPQLAARLFRAAQ
jgi:hypothetical protein